MLNARSLLKAGVLVFMMRDTIASVTELTDDNFDELVTGDTRWMIDIYAPWCKHCAVLEPVWTSLAERLEGKVMVGKVDGTREKALMKRFSCEAFPSIYIVAGPHTRPYAGLRTLQELENFALLLYKDVQPLPFYKSPTSLFGRASGYLIRLPARFKVLIEYLHEEKKYSALAILAGILGVPLSVGVLLVYMLDVFFGARARSQTHQHRD